MASLDASVCKGSEYILEKNHLMEQNDVEGCHIGRITCQRDFGIISNLAIYVKVTMDHYGSVPE